MSEQLHLHSFFPELRSVEFGKRPATKVPGAGNGMQCTYVLRKGPLAAHAGTPATVVQAAAVAVFDLPQYLVGPVGKSFVNPVFK